MSNGEDKKFDLGKTIGTIETNISHIKETVDGVNGKVDSIGRELMELSSSTVKRDECTKRTKMITDSMSALAHDLQQQQPQEVEEVEEQKPWLQRVKENATAIITIFTLIGLLGAGVYKLAHVIVKVESALAQQSQTTVQQTKTLKQELRKIDKTRVVYVPMPVYPDAGVKPRRYKRRNR